MTPAAAWQPVSKFGTFICLYFTYGAFDNFFGQDFLNFVLGCRERPFSKVGEPT